MMEEWGVPTFYLQSMANELVGKLAAKGAFIPSISIAGGFSTEDHVFKVLAMGAPHTVAVCMGRALMIPGLVGRNIEKWLADKDLPKSVSEFGGSKDELFVTYETLRKQFGAEVDNFPAGALGVYTYTDKIKIGLQQLMCGSRNMKLSTISRSDLMALTREASEVSGIPFVMDAYREEAMRIIEA
jgi:glutamate synthase domain-containing protein 2